MRSGDLKALVISVLNESVGLSVKEVKKRVEDLTSREHAYTTISTVLNRLESENLVIMRKAKIDKRTVNLYYLSDNAYKDEVNSFVKSLLHKFGFNAVKHLGQLLDTNLNDEDLVEIERKLKEK